MSETRATEEQFLCILRHQLQDARLGQEWRVSLGPDGRKIHWKDGDFVPLGAEKMVPFRVVISDRMDDVTLEVCLMPFTGFDRVYESRTCDSVVDAMRFFDGWLETNGWRGETVAYTYSSVARLKMPETTTRLAEDIQRGDILMTSDERPPVVEMVDKRKTPGSYECKACQHEEEIGCVDCYRIRFYGAARAITVARGEQFQIIATQ